MSDNFIVFSINLDESDFQRPHLILWTIFCKLNWPPQKNRFNLKNSLFGMLIKIDDKHSDRWIFNRLKTKKTTERLARTMLIWAHTKTVVTCYLRQTHKAEDYYNKSEFSNQHRFSIWSNKPPTFEFNDCIRLYSTVRDTQRHTRNRAHSNPSQWFMRAFVVDHRHELRAIELFEVELWRSEKFEEKK